MEKKIFLFLGGLHRSGTSLLHGILRSHPKISGFRNSKVPEDEGQHLQSVYLPAKAFGGPGQFGFDESSFMDEHHPLVSAANAEELFKQWSKYQDLRCTYLIEKSPPNLVRTRFLQAMFSNSLFIMILRHPIAVAYATQKWSGTSIMSLIEHWLLCHERFLADLPYLTNCFVLRYEELVSSPQKRINRVYRFVGLDSVPIEREVHVGMNEKYFETWSKDKTGLLKRLPAAYEVRTNRIGYSLRHLEELLSAPFLGPHNVLRIRGAR